MFRFQFLVEFQTFVVEMVSMLDWQLIFLIYQTHRQCLTSTTSVKIHGRFINLLVICGLDNSLHPSAIGMIHFAFLKKIILVKHISKQFGLILNAV